MANADTKKFNVWSAQTERMQTSFELRASIRRKVSCCRGIRLELSEDFSHKVHDGTRKLFRSSNKYCCCGLAHDYVINGRKWKIMSASDVDCGNIKRIFLFSPHFQSLWLIVKLIFPILRRFMSSAGRREWDLKPLKGARVIDRCNYYLRLHINSTKQQTLTPEISFGGKFRAILKRKRICLFWFWLIQFQYFAETRDWC